MLKTLTLITLISSPLMANDFGQYTAEAKARLAQERVNAIISKSTADRKAFASTRELASSTPQDEAWAKEYDSLMATDDSTDYLQKSLDL